MELPLSRKEWGKKKQQFIDIIRLVHTPETNCSISDQLQNKENYYLKPQIYVESDTYEIKKISKKKIISGNTNHLN